MEDRKVKLNIRIQREEASTGDIKRGWANSTQAEDQDSGSNPGKEEMGGSRFRIQVVGNTEQMGKCKHCRQFGIGEHIVYNDSGGKAIAILASQQTKFHVSRMGERMA